MIYHRRKFIRTLGAGVAVAAFSNPLLSCGSIARSNRIQNNFGLQLYTLRDDMAKDPKAVLKQVASDGYKQIESFEGPKGIFWGMTNKEFKSYMDDLGMTIVSSHCNIDKDFEQKADQASAIGMKYLLCPWIGLQKNLDDYKKAAEKFNQRGEVCKKAGIRFGYHNHDYGFIAVDGQFPQDIIMQNSDPSLVDFEMDIYWVVTAGQDPIHWLEKYPNRFRLCHIKDRRKDAAPSERDAFTVLGTGKIDFPKILKVGEKKGLDYFIAEQDQSFNLKPLEAAKENADYLKKIKI